MLGEKKDQSSPTQKHPDWKQCMACGKWLPPRNKGWHRLLLGSGQGHYCRWWASPL